MAKCRCGRLPADCEQRSRIVARSGSTATLRSCQEALISDKIANRLPDAGPDTSYPVYVLYAWMNTEIRMVKHRPKPSSYPEEDILPIHRVQRTVRAAQLTTWWRSSSIRLFVVERLVPVRIVGISEIQRVPSTAGSVSRWLIPDNDSPD